MIELANIAIDGQRDQRNAPLLNTEERKEFLPDNTMHQGKHCDQVEIQVHPAVTLKKKKGGNT